METTEKPRVTVNMMQELIQQNLELLRGFGLHEREIDYLVNTMRKALRSEHGIEEWKAD